MVFPSADFQQAVDAPLLINSKWKSYTMREDNVFVLKKP